MQQVLVNELYKQWSALKQKNPAISLRAFARRLDVPHSALSEILGGKRKISKRMAQRLIEKMRLDEAVLAQIEESSSYKTVDLQHFKVISEWEHFAILNLLKLKDFKSESTWMAERLGLAVLKVEQALDRLMSVGLLKKLDDGAYVRAEPGHVKTPTDIRSMALQNFTRESFEMAIESLASDEITERDFSTLTLTINRKDMKKAKKLIEEFRYKFDEEMESIPGQDVYKLVLGFYPLSREEGR